MKKIILISSFIYCMVNTVFSQKIKPVNGSAKEKHSTVKKKHTTAKKKPVTTKEVVNLLQETVDLSKKSNDASNNNYIGINNELINSNNELLKSNNELLKSNNELLKNNNEILKSNLETSEKNNVVLKSNIESLSNNINTLKSSIDTLNAANQQQNNTTKDKAAASNSLTLSPTVNLTTFGSNPDWSNASIILPLNWVHSFNASGTKKWDVEIGLNPYIAKSLEIKDSSYYLPALLSAGNWGIEANAYFSYPYKFGGSDTLTITLNPAFGAKGYQGFINNSSYLLQDYEQLKLSLKYNNLFSVGVQYTLGNHNFNSTTTKNFKSIFPVYTTYIQYLDVSAKVRLASLSQVGGKYANPIYLQASWSKFYGSDGFKYLPNSNFYTVGLVTELDIIQNKSVVKNKSGAIFN